jgi:hypothetical protein
MALIRRLTHHAFLPAVLVVLLTLIIMPSSSVSAADFNPGCNVAQLVADLATAGSNGQADTINLTAGCTYTLTSTLVVNADSGNLLTINGNGATLSGNDARLVLRVNPDAVVTINNVIISDGRNVPGDGGAIENYSATLTLNNSTISGNTAGTGSVNTFSQGGAVMNSYGILTLNNSTISENSLDATSENSSASGGGIMNYKGYLTVNNSTITNNSVNSDGAGYGGGISSFEGTMTLYDSSVSDNSVTGDSLAYGGGIHIVETDVTLMNSIIESNVLSGRSTNGGGISNEGVTTLTNTIVSGNSANASGGGIFNRGSLTVDHSTVSGNTASYGGGIANAYALTVTNSTINNNYAYTDGGGISNFGLYEGGIIIQRGNATFINSTISNNSAFAAAGGISAWLGEATTLINTTVSGNSSRIMNTGVGVYVVSGNVVVSNSIIANNSVNEIECSVHDGATSNISYSLIEDGSCGIVNGVNGNRTGDPNLGALVGNPDYHPLNAGSIAINAGSNALIPAGVTADQAGNARIIGGIVDMGSVESSFVPTNTPTRTPTNTPTSTRTATPTPAPTEQVPFCSLIDLQPPAFSMNTIQFMIINTAYVPTTLRRVSLIWPTFVPPYFPVVTSMTFADVTIWSGYETVNPLIIGDAVSPPMGEAHFPFLNFVPLTIPARSSTVVSVQLANAGTNLAAIMTTKMFEGTAIYVDDPDWQTGYDCELVYVAPADTPAPTPTPSRTPTFNPSASPTFTPPAPDLNIISNGTFSAGLNDWAFSGTTQQVSNGALQIAPTSPGGSFYQFVNFNSAGEIFEVNFRASNSSATAKTLNLMVRDADWSPLYNCVFGIPAYSPFQNYWMRFDTSEGFIPMVLQGALSGDATMGLLIDDITMVRRTGISVPTTECTVSPPANTNLVYDGAFNQGTANWAAFNAAMQVVNIGGSNGNVMELARWNGTPNGGFYQYNPYSAPANGVLQFTFQIGNQSNQSRVINILVRDPFWVDVHSCFITVPANTPLTNLQIRLKTWLPWSNIVIQGWIQVGDYTGTPPLPFRFDNLNLQYLPSSGFSGSTQCPGPMPIPARQTDTPTPTITPSLTPSLTATLTPTVTATPTSTETAAATSTFTVTSTETVLPTITAVATETPTDMPTPEPPTVTPEPPTNTPEPLPEVTQSP